MEPSRFSPWQSPPNTKTYAARAGLVIQELDRAAEVYRAIRLELEAARQKMEIARATLLAQQSRAAYVLDRNAWGNWQVDNQDLMAIGREIGDAVLDALWVYALEAAHRSIESRGKVRYDPAATTTHVVASLDRHGFEWRTGTPGREVHAALLRLKGVVKTKDGRYARNDAREVYAMAEQQTYLGIALGDAISHILEAKATDSARETAWSRFETGSKEKDFTPWMSAEDIVGELQRGGFRFADQPLREVHDALANLEGVEKRGGLYKTKRADAILDKTTDFVTDHVRDLGNEWNAANQPPPSEDGTDARE